MQELRVILIGRSGHGKSATGNTILRDQNFKTCVSSTAVTIETSFGEETYNNCKLKVIDTPGYFDITNPTEDTYAKMKTELIKIIAFSVPGPNAFLYVLKAGRYTEEDIQSIKTFLHVFGPSMKEYMIFVFTHFNEIKDEYNTLDDYIADLPPVLLKVIHECGNRVLAIDNRYGSENEKSSFSSQLIATLHMMKGKHYTNDAFEEATLAIKEQVNELMETKHMTNDAAIKAVFSDIQTEGNIFKILKEKRYLLASFATTVLSGIFFGAPGLVCGVVAIAAGWVTYNCKKI